MAVWEQFRALAARIGMTHAQIEDVENDGQPALVQDPRDPLVRYRVRPDPEWTARLSDAWHGKLVNSRREHAGVMPITDGRLQICDASRPEEGVIVSVAAGDYEVVATIAHLGGKARGDYEEHVSHVQALLSGADAIVAIEPLTGDDGAEVFIEALRMAFAGSGAIEKVAAERVNGRIFAMDDFLVPEMRKQSKGHWASVAANHSPYALVAVSAGHGRGHYPLFKLTDAAGNVVGVLVDFYIDNRPYGAVPKTMDEGLPS